MPTNSKSIRRKKKKLRFIKKLKQPWRVTRNWLQLPSDLMLDILQRVGVVDRLKNVQRVCTTWRHICKDPFMWRVVYIEQCSDFGRAACKEICKQAVDRSQGQLLDLTMVRFCDYELLRYVAYRSSHLRRLHIVYFFGGQYGGMWWEVFKKLSLLEELCLVRTKVQAEYIEAAGYYCPLLKTLKVNRKASSLWAHDVGYDDYVIISNEVALAIGKNLPELTHLELIGSGLENIGLKAILDGCCHLESLDLRRCSKVDLKGDLGKRCSQQIKYLKLPDHSLEGYLSTYDILDHNDDGDDGHSDYDDDTSYVDDDTSTTSYDDDDDDDDTSGTSYDDSYDTSTTSYDDDDDDDDDDDTSATSYEDGDDNDVDDYEDSDDVAFRTSLDNLLCRKV